MSRLLKIFTVLLATTFVILLFYALVFFHLSMAWQNEATRAGIDKVIQRQAADRQKLEQLELQKEELQERLDQLLEIFGQVEIKDFTVTAYAPLDPAAIEGICYSGDPNVTASGGRPIPGETVAAGPSIPFGSRVWIEGVGIRTVNDRGGRITDNHLDLAVASRKEAFEWGRQTVRAVVLP